MINEKKHEESEWNEFLLIKESFPEARLKEDYNREILDVGVEIPTDHGIWTLLKGEQTNHHYELISPTCKWFEDLDTLADVYNIIHSCRDSS